jgi:outer membrane protein OmpA-like peptidoglycan-associated protein/opacity protein-like surface antigen
MKKIILFVSVLTVLIFTSVSAFAESTYNWTGFYAGLQGMYGHGNTKWEYTSNYARADHTINGWMGGIFLGYNYQFPVNVVVGVETDINYGKISGSASAPNPVYLVNTETNWLGSTRIRVGYAVWRFLPYVAAGVAYGRAKTYATYIATGEDYGETNTYIGWTPSAGLEFAITQNLKARLEYSYYDLGKKQFYTVLPTVPVEATITFEGIKFGLCWSFGGQKEAPAPAPAPAQEIKKEAQAAPVVEQKIEKSRIELKVEFDSGQAIVKPNYYKEIEAVADIMKKNPDLNIVIEGHTDKVMGEKYNLDLSQRRAEAIKKIMVTKYNIDASRIAAKGFGFSKPIADNKTKEGRQKNRRIEAAVEYTIKK